MVPVADQAEPDLVILMMAETVAMVVTLVVLFFQHASRMVRIICYHPELLVGTGELFLPGKTPETVKIMILLLLIGLASCRPTTRNNDYLVSFNDTIT